MNPSQTHTPCWTAGWSTPSTPASEPNTLRAWRRDRAGCNPPRPALQRPGPCNRRPGRAECRVQALQRMVHRRHRTSPHRHPVRRRRPPRLAGNHQANRKRNRGERRTRVGSAIYRRGFFFIVRVPPRPPGFGATAGTQNEPARTASRRRRS
jgi:hypothetical protein